MSSDHTRDRGRLFTNKEKKKPSQPDMQGEARFDGNPHAASAWEREEQLVVSFLPPRERKGQQGAGEIRGSLDAVAAKRAKGDDEPSPVWMGEVIGPEASYTVRAFAQQGKSGAYLSLEIERLATHAAPLDVELTPPPIE